MLPKLILFFTYGTYIYLANKAVTVEIPNEIRKHIQKGNSSNFNCGEPLYIMNNELIKNVKNVNIGNNIIILFTGFSFLKISVFNK